MIAKHLPMRGSMLAFTEPLEEFFAAQLLTMGSMVAAAQDEFFRKNAHAMAIETTIVDCEGRRVAAFVLRTRDAMALLRIVMSAGMREVTRQVPPAQAKGAVAIGEIIVQALTDLLGESAQPVPSALLVQP